MQNDRLGFMFSMQLTKQQSEHWSNYENYSIDTDCIFPHEIFTIIMKGETFNVLYNKLK